MGRKNRERIARIEAGEEMSISERAKQALNNPLIRKAVALKSRGAVIETLKEGTTDDQVNRLNELRVEGALPGRKLKSALMKKAPGEMDKAIKKFRREGKPINVDTLCAEIRSTPGFLKMCEGVGLTLAWFESLARERMEANGL